MTREKKESAWEHHARCKESDRRAKGGDENKGNPLLSVFTLKRLAHETRKQAAEPKGYKDVKYSKNIRWH